MAATSLGNFILGTSTLGGPIYVTAPFDMQGEFRDIQLHWSQTVSNQDMEGHFLEFHFTLSGVDEAL